MRTVVVTEHAVERFIERSDFEGDYAAAEQFVKKAVERGRYVRRQPGNTFLICGKSYYFLVQKTRKGELVVITCYGDRRMLAWYNRQHRRERARFAYA